MENCIFCQIVAGKSPCFKIYEDQIFLGFLDKRPRSKGHTLVIPKTHYRWVYEVPDFASYWQTALKITKSIQSLLKPVWLEYFTFGYIPHAHIHIIPRYERILDAEALPARIETIDQHVLVDISHGLANLLT